MSSRRTRSPYRSSRQFMFRSPMLPFRAFAGHAIDGAPRAPETSSRLRADSGSASDPEIEFELKIDLDLDAADEQWGDMVNRMCAEQRARLRALVELPHVRDALFVASPGLEADVPLWLADPDTDRARKIEWALVRYVARMTGRATPFGLFSGISVGSVARETALITESLADYERHTRLDNDYLFLLTEALTREPEIRHHLVFYCNDSLFSSAGRMRYVEAQLDGKRRSHQLVTVELNEYVSACLRRARPGATSNQLANGLVDDDPEIELDEAREFIDELIDSQLLVSRLTPAVTGREPVHGIIAELRKCASKGALPAGEIADCLQQVTDDLVALDGDGLGAAPDRYRALAARLEALPVPVDLARLFQVDLVKPAPHATLGERDVQRIARGVDILHRLGANNRKTAMTTFREAFRARYEGREVPLLEALDEDSGVGFMVVDPIAAEPSPVLRGLRFPPAKASNEQQWRPVHDLLAREVQHKRSPRDGALELRMEDIDKLDTGELPPLPDAFSVMVTIATRVDGPGGRDASDPLIRIMFASGPSGARLAGRFCHASAEVEQVVRDHLRAEEALVKDAVFAEIVHLPEGRIGNVVCRPVLREYEIPYLGVSGADGDKQISLDDLMVSVTRERVVLRSRRLGCEVIPRLSTAHNIMLGTSLYRFLGFLQNDNLGTASWSWGPLERLPYLPRVTCGRLVFSRARWRLEKDELRALGAAAKAPKRKARLGRARAFKAMQRLRAARELPRWIVLIDGDNELPVDLDNPLSCDSFVQMVKGRANAVLCELFPDEQQLAATGPEGAFCAQVVVPFVREREPRPAALHEPRGDLPRSFAPGSEWLYFKLYTGIGYADRVLYETLAPLVRELIARGACESWFFIRYGDPEHHLRVRFSGERDRLASEVLPALHRAIGPLVQQEVIWRVQLDTYEREIERYGGASGMELSEQLFAADSDTVLAMMPFVAGDGGADLRWQMAVMGLDILLDDFGFDTTEKFNLARRLREGFGAEFRADASFYKQVGVGFRERRRDIANLLARDFEPLLSQEIVELGEDEEWEDEGEYRLLSCVRALRARSDRLRPVVAALRERAQAEVLNMPLEGLVSSYIHMYLNRLFRSAHRAQELVIYDYVRRLYASQRARS